jgi:hypothetical protein
MTTTCRIYIGFIAVFFSFPPVLSLLPSRKCLRIQKVFSRNVRAQMLESGFESSLFTSVADLVDRVGTGLRIHPGIEGKIRAQSW